MPGQVAIVSKRKKVVILNNRYTSRVIATQFALLRKRISYLLEKGNKVCLHLEEVATQFMFMNKTNLITSSKRKHRQIVRFRKKEKPLFFCPKKT